MRAVVAGMIVVAALAACNDTSAPEDEALTREEALELAENLSAAIEAPAATLASGGGATLSGNDTYPCTPSGNMEIGWSASFSFDETTQKGSFQFAASARPSGCTFRTENGSTITVTGDPDIDFTMTGQTAAGGVTALTLDETGAFTWTRGGASGRCTLSIRSTLVSAPNAYQITGTFCGFPVGETIPVGG